MRRISLISTAILFLLSLAVMTAWACTNLATLNLSAAAGEAGTQVDVTGSSFASTYGEGQDVVIHWDATDGAVLATATPDAVGNISTTIRIPDSATPGDHVLVATQDAVAEDGSVSPSYGTPARAAFLVGTPPQTGQPVVGGPATTGVAPAAGPPAALILLTAVFGLLGLGLFGAGVGRLVRRGARAPAPVPAPVDDRTAS